MNRDMREQIERLFHEAASLPVEEVAAWLRNHCANESVRSEVLKLLRHDASEQGRSLPDELERRFQPTREMNSGPGDSDGAGRQGSDNSSAIDHGRFLPGTLLSDRYRIVGILGRGGMGEVYRADDLELGQSVALKLLPDTVSNDPRMLNRFRSEVRLARQVSHPNVCRVYDIGQVDGQTFLSMEYVDGEDLAQLLRRIGRFAEDRATELARQLCQGLQAAHEKGVLHRDLKPANIMIDGRGKLLITDFGLAEVAHEVAENDIRSGTPAYMSPEQLAGREVTERSDIYSLGIILHEIFTGKPVWEADSLAELFEKRRTSETPIHTSSVADLDPVVERVIRRCLDTDPDSRPASAISVAAGLPGGDPLQAALAAGELPSPEMVAAAGEDGRLSPRTGGLVLAATCLVLLACPFVLDAVPCYQWDELREYEPAVLKKMAVDVIRSEGVVEEPVGTAYGFSLNAGREFEFWYRQGSVGLEPSIPDLYVNPRSWHVYLWNPEPNLPGMVTVRLNSSGQVIEFTRFPDGYSSTTSTGTPDYDAIFSQFAVDDEAFSPCDVSDVSPRLLPHLYVGDIRVWREDSNAPNPEVIVVGFQEGQLSYFRRIRTARADSLPTYSEFVGAFRFARWRVSLVFLFVMSATGIFAYRNLRDGLADVRGATRCAAYYFVIDVVLGLLSSRYFGEPSAIVTLGVNVLFRSLSVSLRIWMYYVAVEAFVRRLWPSTFSSWSRLVAGRYGDRLVGRDVLVGVFTGTCIAAFTRFVGAVSDVNLGGYGLSPDATAWSLRGFDACLAEVLSANQRSIGLSLMGLMVLICAKGLLRNTFVCLILYALTMTFLSEQSGLAAWSVVFPVFAIDVILIARFGFLAVIARIFVHELLWHIPLTAQWSAWYSQPTIVALVTVVCLAAATCYTSTSGGSRPGQNLSRI